ncbi:alpha/beta fold hydrolase [Nonomuraea insulae]|uniref:Alpha/beta fold hydrolase n=1 Tax=Nonomuraea insulae TaxID=1616787 RepID=A0ABW1CQ66_9ACTN
MPTFTAPDGTTLAYHVRGDGAPLICLPGGPMQDSTYLGDLGGLPAHRRLIMLDPRGTGHSAKPQDPATYRCDRMIGDVEALRHHLGLDRVDLLAHCAGASMAMSYATSHPARVAKLALITPSTKAVAIEPTGQARLRLARLRAHEPWFPTAFAALEAIVAGEVTAERVKAIDPFFYGRWDEETEVYQAAHDEHRNDEAAAQYTAEGAFDPEATRAALASFGAPVLVLAGEVDLNTPPSVAAELAGLFPDAEFVVQPGAGHFPWRDDSAWFVPTIATFLD